MTRPTDEELATSILRSRAWRQTRRFKFIPEKQSQYIAEFVRDFLRGYNWIPPEEFVSKVEAVTKVIRSRMAIKAAQTRKRVIRQKKLEQSTPKQWDLFRAHT